MIGNFVLIQATDGRTESDEFDSKHMKTNESDRWAGVGFDDKMWCPKK